MNLVEKKRCLFCQQLILATEPAFVMVSVLVAHPRCIPGARHA